MRNINKIKKGDSMKKKVFLLSIMAAITLGLGFSSTEIAQSALAASTKWTSLNNEVTVNDGPGDGQVTFTDSVDAGWSDLYYTGAVYNEALDIRDNIYELTISTTQLQTNGSLYVTLSNNPTAPWDSYNWSVGALILRIDYWGKFNWDADYNGAIQISASNSMGATVAGDPVNKYLGTAPVKIAFDVKATGTIIRIDDEVAFTCDANSRAHYDYWSNYQGLLSVGPYGTRTSTTSYQLSVGKVSRVANARVDGTGKELVSTADGGFRMTNKTANGWYQGALYQGVAYDELIDVTQEVEITAKAVNNGNVGTFYIIFTNSLTLPYSNAFWYPSFIGIGVANYGSWERVIPLNSSGSDPASSLYFDSATFNNVGLTFKFVFGSTSTDLYIDGVKACSFDKGINDYYQYSSNKATLSFGGYEQTVENSAFEVRVNNSASDTYAVEHFVRTYLHEEVALDDAGTGKCTSQGWFEDAKAAYNALSTAQKSLFEESQYTIYYNRLYSWALANNSVLSNGTIAANQITTFKKNNDLIVIISAALIIATSVALAIWFIRRKREA